MDMSKNKKGAGDGKREPSELPSISTYTSRSEWEKDCWRKISSSQKLLELIVTPYERRNLILRAAARDSIALGKSYREIGKELWLSPQTVSGLKKAVSEKSYRSYRERSKKERRKRVYSSDRRSKRSRPEGIPRRTKYGIVYM